MYRYHGRCDMSKKNVNDCQGISAYRLTAPCLSAYEHINARRLMPLHGQLHVPWQSKLLAGHTGVRVQISWKVPLSSKSSKVALNWWFRYGFHLGLWCRLFSDFHALTLRVLYNVFSLLGSTYQIVWSSQFKHINPGIFKALHSKTYGALSLNI